MRCLIFFCRGALAISLLTCASSSETPLEASRPALMKRINDVMDMTMKDCSYNFSDDPSCLEIMFWENYRAFVITDQVSLASGPPGIPGRIENMTMRQQHDDTIAWMQNHPPESSCPAGSTAGPIGPTGPSGPSGVEDK